MGPGKLRLGPSIQLVLAFHQGEDSAFMCVFILGLSLSGSCSWAEALSTVMPHARESHQAPSPKCVRAGQHSLDWSKSQGGL